jgi:hypothetical protein
VERGDVHLILVELPDRMTGIMAWHDKYAVLLRGGTAVASEADVPYLLASSDRRTAGQPLRAFEVSVGVAEGFSKPTILDCRWVWTRMKTDFSPSSHRFRLPAAVRKQISVALVAGLQMNIA